MKEKDLLFSEEIYLEQLSTINEVNFISREINVIACLLNAWRKSQIKSMGIFKIITEPLNKEATNTTRLYMLHS